MKYEIVTLTVLHELGIQKMYKGCEYILSSINYINENQETYSPITKVLYVDIAKQYNTSGMCVERNMRNVIEFIWKIEKNEEVIARIFGEYFKDKRPSNMEFLMLLYHYIQCCKENAANSCMDGYTFVCPALGKKCEYCAKIIMDTFGECDK